MQRIDWQGRCDDGFIWNSSICECDKSCDVGEYLDYGNCKCRKKLDKLVKECSEDIDGNEMTHNVILNDYRKLWNSCKIYIVLSFILFIIIVGIGSIFLNLNCFINV